MDSSTKRKMNKTAEYNFHKIKKQEIDESTIGDYEIRNGFLNEKRIKRLIIYLRSSGCQWMLDDPNGGCTMCGHISGTTQGEKISAQNYIEQFDKAIDKFDFSESPMVCIYNAGSFLNDNEMPKEARDHILKKVASIDAVKHIIIESRPEYITTSTLSCAKDITVGKTLEIGIGVESSDSYIREVCLNKGFDEHLFANSIEIMNKLNIKALAYILAKPPFLSEKRAINDSIKTIKWAFENGVDVVSLEPVSVQKNTLVHLLYKMGLYRPQWIWSVLEIIKQVHGYGAIRIGGFEFFPPPSVCTHNCSVCNEYCIESIEEYNATNNVDVITEALKMDCKNCKHEWISEKETLNFSPIEQIDFFLKKYNKTDVNILLRNDYRNYPNNLLRVGGCGIHSL